MELLYSLYHHVEIGDETPTDVGAAVDIMSDESSSRIYVDAKSKLLYLQSSDNTQFKLGVFNASGTLLLTSDLSDGDAVSLEALSPGVYVAVASDGRIKFNSKFILN